jgi:uncharacterized phage protein gp47/JayE
MQLSLQTFNTLVRNMAAGVQSATTQLVDLSVGSVLRAVLESNASVGLWMQWLILQVLRMTRAATSSGADLDSWVADYTLARLPAVAATGQVTFSRYTPGLAALIPIGALVRTADGSQTFAVTADATNSAWSASSNGYAVASGVASLTVPVSAQAAGAAGNVQAATVSLLATAIPGIDTVSNAAAFQNGMDAESDAALRARFCNFISSRSRATTQAVGYAVSSIQQGLEYVIQENVDASGQPRMGSFLLTVDDGSGTPPTTLLSTVQASVNAVRPVGSLFSVQPPTVVVANVSLTINVATGADQAQATADVGNALQAYINTLSIGASLPLTRLAQIAYSANQTIVNVGQLQINGGTSDLVPAASAVIKAGTVAVD